MSITLAGRYQVVHELGTRGKMHVYQAIDSRIGTPVIVRTLAMETEDDRDAFLRFQQDGTVLTLLHHPNIWRIHTIFLEGTTGYMVLEWVEGLSLSEVLQEGRLPLDRVVSIGRQTADALAYMHGKGVVHSDVSPDNIMISPQDEVRLRAINGLQTAWAMKAGTFSGMVTGLTFDKPIYLAPERITEQPSDHRVDVYSLGAVLYHMATGRPPFEGTDAMAVADAVIRTMPPRPSVLNGALTAEWDTVLGRAMTKNPDGRFPTMVAMERAIQLLAPSGTAVQPPATAGSTCPNCGRQGTGQYCTYCGTRLRP